MNRGQDQKPPRPHQCRLTYGGKSANNWAMRESSSTWFVIFLAAVLLLIYGTLKAMKAFYRWREASEDEAVEIWNRSHTTPIPPKLARIRSEREATEAYEREVEASKTQMRTDRILRKQSRYERRHSV